MTPPDETKDPEGLVDLQDAIHRRPDARRRIGMGLQALCNRVLMERLPPRFTELLRRLDRAERPKEPPRDPGAKG